MNFLYVISPISLGMQMCLDFQLFGINIIIGLGQSNNYSEFQYLTMAGIAVFFSIVVKMRLAFMAVRMQHYQNPLIFERNCRNPLFIYAFVLGTFIFICYVSSFFVMTYKWYNYVLMLFYLFPLPQILHSAKVGSRKCFKWYIFLYKKLGNINYCYGQLQLLYQSTLKAMMVILYI